MSQSGLTGQELQQRWDTVHRQSGQEEARGSALLGGGGRRGPPGLEEGKPPLRLSPPRGSAYLPGGVRWNLKSQPPPPAPVPRIWWGVLGPPSSRTLQAPVPAWEEGSTLPTHPTPTSCRCPWRRHFRGLHLLHAHGLGELPAAGHPGWSRQAPPGEFSGPDGVCRPHVAAPGKPVH